MTKYIYAFEEGNAGMRDLLGGKGANLCEMTGLGFSVPPGFVISTEACNQYVKEGAMPEGLMEQVMEAMNKLEEKAGKKFGDINNPLLVSVRSGAKFSMPGMMDTILNLGLNEKSLSGMIRQSSNERFGYDSFRRFIQMFSDIVLRIGKDKFEERIQRKKEEKSVNLDTELTVDDLKDLVEEFKNIVRENTGELFPEAPKEQLERAIRAVFESWNNPRAIVYRRASNISDDLGTGVSIQMMVYGNMGDDSATGVAFTRNPSNGDNNIFGEYLINAQGEDVVAGTRTPKPISELQDDNREIYQELVELMSTLEKHYKDMQDIEFTMEKGKLYMLQTRNGKRTAQAGLKIAVNMVEEALITEEAAILRIDPAQLDQLLHPRLDPDVEVNVLAKGLPASPGAATGKVTFDADLAEELGKKGEKVILVRWETTPDDIHGIIPSQGVLTAHGGMTSHAAVVARGMGKPCVTGCEKIRIDISNKIFKVDEVYVKEGDIISIDGGSGRVMLGEIKLIPPTVNKELQKVLEWTDRFKRLGVRANADTDVDAKKAREFGAKGIGLCRTEHMFFGEDRLPIMQDMILADSSTERDNALAKLLPVQKSDFEKIFRVMEELPVTIRLLDPPLHEFLPDLLDLKLEIEEMKRGNAKEEEIIKKENLAEKVRLMSEANPMLGLRGCRLGLTFPSIYEMQVRAIAEAATNVTREGIKPDVEIMIPLVSTYNELKVLRIITEKVLKNVTKETGVEIEYKIGTMIELPRAAVTADEIVEYADFFSFGTNDLTQTTYGFSRDDAEGKFLPKYLEEKILPENPFEVLDVGGVGKLVETACNLGRKVKPDIKLGICGEHGGEPKSIEFCHNIGLTYISCSPFRVPVARLAAAQAVLKKV